VVGVLDLPRAELSVFVYFAYQNHWFGLDTRWTVDGIINEGHTRR